MTPRADIIGGGVLVVLALATLHQATELDLGALRGLGPGMLPMVLGAALLGCGATLLVVGGLQKGAAVEYLHARWRGPIWVGLAVLVFALTIEGMDIAGVAAPQLGLAVTGPVTLILAGYGSTEARLRDLAAVGFGLTAFCLALFNDALAMDLPVVPGAAQALLVDRLGSDATLRLAYLLCGAIAFLLALPRLRAVRS